MHTHPATVHPQPPAILMPQNFLTHFLHPADSQVDSLGLPVSWHSPGVGTEPAHKTPAPQGCGVCSRGLSMPRSVSLSRPGMSFFSCRLAPEPSPVSSCSVGYPFIGTESAYKTWLVRTIRQGASPWRERHPLFQWFQGGAPFSRTTPPARTPFIFAPCCPAGSARPGWPERCSHGTGNPRV